MVDHFFDGVAGRSHGNDDLLGIGGAHIVEKVVLTAGQGTDLFHIVGHDGRYFQIIRIDGLATLKVDIRVLGRTAQFRSLGVHGPGAEFGQGFPVDQLGHIIVVDDFDFLDFVAGPETVEKVNKGNAGFDGDQVGDQGQVHGLLHRSRCDHTETGLAHGHDILMVAENAQGMSGDGARRNVKHAGQQLAAHFVHVGNHQQQSLRCRIGAGQRTGRQTAVYGRCRAGLALHLTDEHLLAENVLQAIGSPFIANLTDGRRRGDGVYCSHITQGISHMCCCSVAIHSFHFFSHPFAPYCL